MKFFKKIKDKIAGNSNPENENNNDGSNIKNEQISSSTNSTVENNNDENIVELVIDEIKEIPSSPYIADKMEGLSEPEKIIEAIENENSNSQNLTVERKKDDEFIDEFLAISETETSEIILDDAKKNNDNFSKSKISTAENKTVKNETVEEETVKNETIEKEKTKKSFFSKTSNFFSSIVEKTKVGLTKTRQTFSDNLKKILTIGRKIDEKLLNEIEELLITADIGVDTTEQIIDSLRKRVKAENYENAEDLYRLLRDEIQTIMIESPSANNDKLYELDANNKPFVILVIGVNGVGKTTTIGKLAYNYKNNGKNVIIGAADTFRAAANEQLEIWAERAGVDIVQQQQGADPAAVTFDTVKSAQSKNKDVVIIDTAGRLHNKANLMAELEKIIRVMRKLKAEAPDEIFLVLDATTGQNAILQAKEFSRITPLTGIILTKLDGTAKGGVVIPIANELKIPVRYIGVGEKIDDLQPFDAKTFVESLFDTLDEKPELKQ